MRAFRENVRFVRSNGRKTTFGWPKVVSEVSFPRFWGVICIAKCFCFFVSVIGSAVSKISRYARFYVKRTNRDISETSLAITETKTLCNTKYPPKPKKTHLRNHFWPLESGFRSLLHTKVIISQNTVLPNFPTTRG